jgi:hypothetical protein
MHPFDIDSILVDCLIESIDRVLTLQDLGHEFILDIKTFIKQLGGCLLDKYFMHTVHFTLEVFELHFKGVLAGLHNQ